MNACRTRQPIYHIVELKKPDYPLAPDVPEWSTVASCCEAHAVAFAQELATRGMVARVCDVRLKMPDAVLVIAFPLRDIGELLQ